MRGVGERRGRGAEARRTVTVSALVRTLMLLCHERRSVGVVGQSIESSVASADHERSVRPDECFRQPRVCTIANGAHNA